MSAKKRGPGRPPKAKTIKSEPRHVLPSHFWVQIGAIILAALSIVLLVGLFGAGGAMPVGLATIVRSVVGWTAFILPIVIFIQVIQIFKQSSKRTPAVLVISMCLLLTVLSGAFQLALPEPTELAPALAGDGGGYIGWAASSLLLNFVDTPIALLIDVVVMTVLALFMMAMSPKAAWQSISNFIGREAPAPTEEAQTPAVTKEEAKVELGGLAKPDKKTRRGLFGRKKKAEADIDIAEEPAKDIKSTKAPDKIEVNSIGKIAKASVPVATSIKTTNWELPSIKILSSKQRQADPGNMKLQAQKIENTLREFGIGGYIRKVNVGPRVTQYCLEPQQGVPLSKISGLQDNIALNMQVVSLRIEAPIPGQPYVGIEIPNKTSASVSLRSILESAEWAKQTSPLAFAVGLNITGDPIVMDLGSLPHLLIAGTTGSGKSVMMNVMVSSMLFRNTPNDLKFVLVDPKGNEMSSYMNMPHLAAPVISGTSREEMHKLTKTLLWLTEEMDRRYEVFRERGGIKKLSDFHKKFPQETMPNIVVVIDEYTDILDSFKSTDREVVATCVQRIAQKGRAAGIHEVVMMQAPRAKYIQGPLKANIPAGFAFMVRSKMESQQIINSSGAETLMGQGDMLMINAKIKKPQRVQAAFVSDEEVEAIVRKLKMQASPVYDESLEAKLSEESSVGGGGGAVAGGSSDDMYIRAVEAVLTNGKASTSFLQRRLGIGFSRAGRLMDEMEQNGIIGPANGSRPREVLISSLDDIK